LPFPFGFGFSDVLSVGREDEMIYLVRFACGCVGLVTRGRMVRRAGKISLVCEHVAVEESAPRA
jgi:hypothetical protein